MDLYNVKFCSLANTAIIQTFSPVSYSTSCRKFKNDWPGFARRSPHGHATSHRAAPLQKGKKLTSAAADHQTISFLVDITFCRFFPVSNCSDTGAGTSHSLWSWSKSAWNHSVNSNFAFCNQWIWWLKVNAQCSAQCTL